MIQTMLAIAAGYFSIAVLNSFIHIIISIYFKKEVALTGIANLPSTTWALGITVLQFALGLFGGLLATTLAIKTERVILGLILLMAAISLIDYSVLSEREPLWYLISAPVLKISGIFIGFKIIQSQNETTITEIKT